MTATVNGIRLSYSDVGQGIPLVCLHGAWAWMPAPSCSRHLDLAQFGIRLIILINGDT